MEVTPELIKKYHQHLCTAEEKKAVEAWLEESTWPDGMDSPVEGEDIVPRQWQSPKSGRSKRLPQRWYWWAASVLVLIGASLFWMKDQGDMAVGDARVSIVEAAHGQIKQIKLEDGTIVFLNAGSRLEIPEHFTDSLRAVRLWGEGHFTVAKDPGRRFVVQTEHSQVAVLGTVFNLKAYPDENQELSVEEGRVLFTSLSHRANGDTLIANERAILDIASNNIHRREQLITSYSTWKEGGFVAEDLSLQVLSDMIQRRYNVAVHVSDPDLLGKHYSGELKKASLKEVLDDIAFVLDCKYRITTDSTIHIYK